MDRAGPYGMRRFLAVLLVAACTPTPQRASRAPRTPPGSRGPRADAHLDAAHDHERRAKELARWPNARTSDTGRFDDPSTGLWYRAWETSGDHDRIATVHRGEAGRISAAYDEECKGAGGGSTSLVQRDGLGGAPTRDGFMVFLPADAGPPERLLAELRCHRAAMMLAETGTDECPLDLAGIQIEALGDASGITVEITVRDTRLVPELQRRAARDLELAAQRREASTR